MSGHLVFCYGSLKSGFHNHRLLTDYNATPLGVATTDGRYLLLKGAAFPFLVDPEDLTHATYLDGVLGKVRGEVYLVDDRCLAALDRLEGHPDFYRRKLIGASFDDDGDKVDPWVYFLTEPAERVHVDARFAARPDARGVVEWKRDDVFADDEQ